MITCHSILARTQGTQCTQHLTCRVRLAEITILISAISIFPLAVGFFQIHAVFRGVAVRFARKPILKHCRVVIVHPEVDTLIVYV